MAHTKYTGKSGGSTVTVGGGSIPTGWRKITISEKGKPLAQTIDTTVAGDSAYVFTADPLGGKGSASATVTVEGFLSVTDHQDTGLLATAIGTAGDVVVKKAVSGDEYTLSGAVYQSFSSGAEFAAVVPYQATFELSTAAGSWAMDVP